MYKANLPTKGPIRVNCSPHMRITRILLPLLLSVMASLPARAQGRAALDQLLAHHTEAEVDQMRRDAHYRYEGELLFYSASFLIEEGGEERAATEEEIRAIDLHAYDAIRMEGQRVGAHDPGIDKHIILLSRGEFVRLMIDRLSEADRVAYLAYRGTVLGQTGSKVR